jgi:hypothetical protein
LSRIAEGRLLPLPIAHKRPRLCENPNSKTQSGKSKPIHGFSIKDVGFMNPVQ